MAQRDEYGNGGEGRLSGSLFVLQSAAMTGHGRETRGTLAALNALAAAYCGTDRTEDAIPLLEQAAAGCRRTLGMHDPDTLVVLGNLAAAHAWLGRWDDALPMLRTNLALRGEVLGEEHPATLAARDALAVTLRLAGRPADALGVHEHVTAQRRRVLGPGHRETLTSRMGLALARADVSEIDAAIEILDSALVDAKVAGADAGTVAALQSNLAHCLATVGAADEARGLLSVALADCESHLGHNHADTIAVRGELARLDASSATTGVIGPTRRRGDGGRRESLRRPRTP